jgi:hypothetical protein
MVWILTSKGNVCGVWRASNVACSSSWQLLTKIVDVAAASWSTLKVYVINSCALSWGRLQYSHTSHGFTTPTPGTTRSVDLDNGSTGRRPSSRNFPAWKQGKRRFQQHHSNYGQSNPLINWQTVIKWVLFDWNLISNWGHSFVRHRIPTNFVTRLSFFPWIH